MSQEDRSHYHQSWWDSWGKSVAFLLLGIVGVVGAILGALIIAGVIF